MEILKHEQLQSKYLNMKQEEVDVTYDVFTLATEPGVADKAAHDAQNSMNVQGFRKGKVPRAIIEKRLGTHNLYGGLLAPLWDQFCMENNIIVGYRSELDEIHARIDGAIVFKIVTMLFPTLELKLRDKYDVDVTQDVIKRVAQQLQALRDKHTQVNPVEGRDTTWGDLVTIDFIGSVDGTEDGDLSAKGVPVQIGARQLLIPGFEEKLVNATIGETQDFDLTIPEDFATRLPNHPRAGYLAGKTVNFNATVNEIKEKVIPQDSELPSLESKETFEELYRDLAIRAFDDIKENLDDICSRASNDIILDNEEMMLKSVQAPIIENRILSFIDKNKQYFEKMDEEQRKEQLTRTVPALTRGVYQDVIYSCLLSKANVDEIEPTREQIEEEAEKLATRAFLQSQGKVKQDVEKARLIEEEYFAIYRSVQRRKVYLALRDKIEVTLDENSEEFVDAMELTSETAPETTTATNTEQPIAKDTTETTAPVSEQTTTVEEQA